MYIRGSVLLTKKIREDEIDIYLFLIIKRYPLYCDMIPYECPRPYRAFQIKHSDVFGVHVQLLP